MSSSQTNQNQVIITQNTRSFTSILKNLQLMNSISNITDCDGNIIDWTFTGWDTSGISDLNIDNTYPSESNTVSIIVAINQMLHILSTRRYANLSNTNLYTLLLNYNKGICNNNSLNIYSIDFYNLMIITNLYEVSAIPITTMNGGIPITYQNSIPYIQVDVYYYFFGLVESRFYSVKTPASSTAPIAPDYTAPLYITNTGTSFQTTLSNAGTKLLVTLNRINGYVTPSTNVLYYITSLNGPNGVTHPGPPGNNDFDSVYMISSLSSPHQSTVSINGRTVPDNYGLDPDDNNVRISYLGELLQYVNTVGSILNQLAATVSSSF